MSQIRLYIDEDAIARELVEAFENANIDVLTTADVNKFSFTDEEQLILATEESRVIYSFNVGDFCRLHGSFIKGQKSHAGIILVQQQRFSIGEQLRGILRLTNAKSAEEMINQLVFLGAYIRAE